jgi:hypothetical protein
MIYANSYNMVNVLRLEIITPGTKQVEIKNITGPSLEQRLADGMNLITWKNKAYILQKLSSWAKMRGVAMEFGRRSNLVMDAAQLRVLLNYHSNRDFYTVCRKVVENKQLIDRLAPAPGSGHYTHYINTIAPIVAYCATMV